MLQDKQLFWHSFWRLRGGNSRSYIYPSQDVEKQKSSCMIFVGDLSVSLEHVCRATVCWPLSWHFSAIWKHLLSFPTGNVQTDSFHSATDTFQWHFILSPLRESREWMNPIVHSSAREIQHVTHHICYKFTVHGCVLSLFQARGRHRMSFTRCPWKVAVTISVEWLILLWTSSRSALEAGRVHLWRSAT